MVKHTATARGFTFIEIVIVCAVAGLIMAVVFLGVGGAQAARRDEVRKHELQALATQIETFASNNLGNYPLDLTNPTDWGATGQYTPANFSDPESGNNYFAIGYATGTNPGRTVGSFAYERGGKACDGVTNLTDTQFMLNMRLEHGIDCIDTR